ncbi:MAG: hypothetical protein JXB29_05445 [Sedimentisphaerales bacterium]|nr:hypothetical protein [Sedimentisphaerales bacterium]
MRRVIMTTETIIVFVGVLNCASPISAAQQALPGPLVYIGVKTDESPYRMSGSIERLDEGTLCFSAQPPWRWITAGKDGMPLRELEGLKSFTICGRVGPTSLLAGSGGNRIVFNFVLFIDVRLSSLLYSTITLRCRQ